MYLVLDAWSVSSLIKSIYPNPSCCIYQADVSFVVGAAVFFFSIQF